MEDWILKTSEIAINMEYHKEELSKVIPHFDLISRYFVSETRRNYDFNEEEFFTLINTLNFLCLNIDDLVIIGCSLFRNLKGNEIILDWLKSKNVTHVSFFSLLEFDAIFNIEFILRFKPNFIDQCYNINREKYFKLCLQLPEELLLQEDENGRYPILANACEQLNIDVMLRYKIEVFEDKYYSILVCLNSIINPEKVREFKRSDVLNIFGNIFNLNVQEIEKNFQS